MLHSRLLPAAKTRELVVNLLNTFDFFVFFIYCKKFLDGCQKRPILRSLFGLKDGSDKVVHQSVSMVSFLTYSNMAKTSNKTCTNIAKQLYNHALKRTRVKHDNLNLIST